MSADATDPVTLTAAEYNRWMAESQQLRREVEALRSLLGRARSAVLKIDEAAAAYAMSPEIMDKIERLYAELAAECPALLADIDAILGGTP